MTSTTTTSRLGGVVFRVFGTDTLSFLPSTIARKVTAIPEMAHIPGAPIELRGVALVDGDMIPIVEVIAEGAEPSSPTGAMLVCAVLGECVGLVGIDVLATGFFDVGRMGAGPDTDHPEVAGKLCVQVPSPMSGAPPLLAVAFDVAGVIARVREGRWAV
jgi:hypothetical protein